MSDEGLLARWSRRKLQDPALREAEDHQHQVAEQLPDSAVDAQPVEAAPPALTDADMPDVESLGEDSDYSLFMSPGVSDELRNLALRKLFRAPMFNQRDGLDEYDDDYTSFEKLGDIVTADMKHQMEMDALKEQAQQLEQEQEHQVLPTTDAQDQAPADGDQPALTAEESTADRAGPHADETLISDTLSQPLTQTQIETDEHDQDKCPRT